MRHNSGLSEVYKYFRTIKNHQDQKVWCFSVGKEGVEPSRLSARDPKSRLSANSSTSPVAGL